jgi:hypothetical protein
MSRLSKIIEKVYNSSSINKNMKAYKVYRSARFDKELSKFDKYFQDRVDKIEN